MRRLRFYHAGSVDRQCKNPKTNQQTHVVLSPFLRTAGCLYPEGWYWALSHRKTCSPCQGPWGPFPAIQGQPLPCHFSLWHCGVSSCGLAPSPVWPEGQVPSPWGCWVPGTGTSSLPRLSPVWLSRWLWTEPTRTPHWCWARGWLPRSSPQAVTPPSPGHIPGPQNTIAAFVGLVNPGYGTAAALLAQGRARLSSLGHVGPRRSW